MQVHTLANMETMNPLTKAGIWCVMMKAAASLSSRCCSFVDELSLGGNDTPKHRGGETRHIVLNRTPECVRVLGLSRYLLRRHLG